MPTLENGHFPLPTLPRRLPRCTHVSVGVSNPKTGISLFQLHNANHTVCIPMNVSNLKTGKSLFQLHDLSAKKALCQYRFKPENRQIPLSTSESLNDIRAQISFQTWKQANPSFNYVKIREHNCHYQQVSNLKTGKSLFQPFSMPFYDDESGMVSNLKTGKSLFQRWEQL